MPTVFGTEITLTPGLAPDQQLMLTEEATTTQIATGRVLHLHEAPEPPEPLLYFRSEYRVLGIASCPPARDASRPALAS